MRFRGRPAQGLEAQRERRSEVLSQSMRLAASAKGEH
jgi:hypothetical protein